MSLVLSQCKGQNGDITPRRPSMDFAEGNFEDLVADGKSAILVSQIEQVIWEEKVDDETLGGLLKLRILREITPQRWHGPQQVKVRFTQHKEVLRRAKWPVGWNNIDVKQGTLVALAVPSAFEESQKATPTPSTVSASTVAQLQSTDDDFVKSVEKALEIEATTDVEQRTALIEQGLRNPLEFLADYCHYALGPLKRIPRGKAVALELSLLEDDAVPLDRRMAAQIAVEDDLWELDSPEDRLNKKIVESFLKVLEVQDENFRRMVVEALYGMLELEENEETGAGETYRTKLLEGVNLPPKVRLLTILRETEKNPDAEAEAAAVRKFLFR
jgi:hypothetical protein